jgi:hypothetical protein
VFRRGLRAALDRGAAAIVKSIEDTGELNDAGRTTLHSAVQAYAQTLLPPAKP